MLSAVKTKKKLPGGIYSLVIRQETTDSSRAMEGTGKLQNNVGHHDKQ